jgi:hypothetical protein|tara:strand:+ start:9079 stop:9654 length:576 start_codon:yes stop_codon:yes gene_type:complete
VSVSLSKVTARQYWWGVTLYIVVLLLSQSMMGLGIDKFKELWGVSALEVVSYSIVVLGAAGVGWAVWKVLARCTTGERVWILIALVAYGIGTWAARSPQERLHYLGYGLLAILLHRGFARSHTKSGGRSTLVLVSGALLVGSSIGFLDELLQIVWPRRYFDWADVGMNIVAVALGLLVAVPTWSALNREPS